MDDPKSSAGKPPPGQPSNGLSLVPQPANDPVGASTLSRSISAWLLNQALQDADLSETVRGLGRKLTVGGLSLYRINVGELLLHPVLGGLDVTWEANSDQCRTQLITRSAVQSAEFRNAPYYNMAKNGIAFRRFKLDDPDARGTFPLLENLAAKGVTDYIAIFETYGRKAPQDWAGLPAGGQGAMFSFSTKRFSGFTDQEVANLKNLSTAFALAIKVAVEKSLSKTLLETYLGKISGSSVLSGLVEKGDGRVIECVLWYSDLRGSTSMASKLDMETYFATINEYFDCAAGAVLDHGGEVLKLIGDAVMAIFPFDDEFRPPVDMCNAAIMTAREAFSRMAAKNIARAEQNQMPLDFGVGMHVGKVMYGNVGTDRRLDLTVTGPAANAVERLESLCKTLSVPIIASADFHAVCGRALAPLGNHKVAGIDAGLNVFTLPEYEADSAELPVA